MTINYLAVALAAIAQFVFGAIWYMPVFGNLWGKIHGFDKLSKIDQAEARKGMTPLLVVQFIGTVVTTLVLAKLIVVLPDYSAFMLAIMVWIGFFVPTQVAAVMFGATNTKWMVTKSAIMAGGSLGCLLIAAVILNAM